MKVCLLALALVLGLSAEEKKKPPAPEKSSFTIPVDYMERFAQLQEILVAKAEIMSLRLCFSAGWSREECRVDWKNGTVSKVPAPEKEDGKKK
jgi:hypothetical protein